MTRRESEDDGDALTHESQEGGSSSLSNSADLSYLKPTASRRTHKSADDLDSAENAGTQTSPDPGGGGFRKGTVTAMASSRAQEAMLRHQVNYIYTRATSKLSYIMVNYLKVYDSHYSEIYYLPL